jgi:hypothetical protein
MAQHSLKVKYIVVPMAAMCRCTKEDDLANTFTPSSLIEIYKFDAMANQIKRQNSGQKLIFASGRNVSVQRRATFLIGCHVIMSHGLDADTTFSMLKNINEHCAENGSVHVKILDCWCALERAKSIGWIDFRERFDFECNDEGGDKSLDMDEFIHYSRYIG